MKRRTTAQRSKIRWAVIAITVIAILATDPELRQQAFALLEKFLFSR